jgi:Fic family protein
VLYVLQAIEETANWTTSKIEAMRRLLEHTKNFIRSAIPKIYSHELVELIFEQPYCRIADVVKANLAERQTASRYLKNLAKIGVLQEEEFGREKVFLHPKLLLLLRRDSNEIAPYLAPSVDSDGSPLAKAESR